MSNRILLDPEKAMAKASLEYVKAVDNVLSKGRRLKAALESMSNGNPPDYSQVALELGLPDPAAVSSTAAQDAHYILVVSVATIDVDAVRALARLDQG